MSVSCIKIAVPGMLARPFAIYAFAFLDLGYFLDALTFRYALSMFHRVDALKTKYSWLEAGSKQSHGR
jgi:hypothetical protein